MPVDESLISKLEKLARLRLSTDERQRLGHDLDRILDFVGRLEQLDTTGVDPLIYLTDADESTGWREDSIGRHLSREEALKNAPDPDGTFFRVPKVI